MARNNYFRRKAGDLETYGPDKIYQLIILGLDNPRDRAFVATLWLTGSRISEIVKKLRFEQLSEAQYNDKTFLVFNNLIVLKKRNKPIKRNVLVPPSDQKFIDLIIEYINSDEKFQDADVMFNFSRQRADQILSKIGLFAHYFRHARASYLANKFGLDGFDLKQYFGWSNSSEADRYAHLNWRRLADQLY